MRRVGVSGGRHDATVQAGGGDGTRCGAGAKWGGERSRAEGCAARHLGLPCGAGWALVAGGLWSCSGTVPGCSMCPVLAPPSGCMWPSSAIPSCDVCACVATIRAHNRRAPRDSAQPDRTGAIDSIRIDPNRSLPLESSSID